MQLQSIFLPLAVATVALASPMVEGVGSPARDVVPRATSTSASASEFTASSVVLCLLPAQATTIVKSFNYLLANPKAANFNSTANALFADNFTDTSDSIDQLEGADEGSVTFASKSEFIAGSSAQAALYLQTLDIFNSCNKISWRWISINGTGDNAEKVKGIDNFYITSSGQISNVYAEFNSAAWEADLGAACVVDAKKAKKMRRAYAH